jgi:hypothetical protein
MAIGVLEKRGLALLEPNPSGRPGTVARLTANGAKSHNAHQQLLRHVEEQWDSRFGMDVTGGYPDGSWRARAALRTA